MKRLPFRGFTLVELLISIGIIGIITAIVVVKFSAFDSAVLLKSAGYEVALTLRDAQVYSVSVYGQGVQFDYPYGVHFVPASKEYIFFRDLDADTFYDGVGEDIKKFTIEGSVEIIDVCVNIAGSDDCTPNYLDISFKRPEFSAYFKDKAIASTGVRSAKIKVKSTKGDDVWIVEVGLLGHISVYKQ